MDHEHSPRIPAVCHLPRRPLTFWQGLVSAQSLISGPDQVSKQFLETVAGQPNGRALPDVRPKKVVFAILLKDGKRLTSDTLFPFSQVTLAHVARTLNTYGTDVEVIGIPSGVS